MANASLKQSVTSLFAEWDAWPEMRSNGTEEAKEIESEETGQKAKIYIASIVTTLIFWASPQLNPASTFCKFIISLMHF